MRAPDTYAIAVLRNTYTPDIQGQRAVAFLAAEYKTIDAAQSVIDSLDADPYCTSHNEAGRPTYVIVDDRCADYIESGRNSDLGNYDWDNCTCTKDNEDCCGECQECMDYMIDQDIEYVNARKV